jgi:ATP-binding cassette subfamily A (ABC1) protein 3
MIENMMSRSSVISWGHARELWDMEITGAPMLYMTFESILYFLCLLGIEHILASPQWVARLFGDAKINEKDLEKEAAANNDEDEDVVAERQRLMDQGTPNDSQHHHYDHKSNGEARDMISIHGMRKAYAGRYGAPPKVAVKNLWFGIPEGQCFGFLGINGAGKTTTLRMLSGDEIPTKGTAYLNGLDIMTQQQEVRRIMGYCPQFDALVETLTAREHLTLFARIKVSQ